jgi:hypothetical protein
LGNFVLFASQDFVSKRKKRKGTTTSFERPSHKWERSIKWMLKKRNGKEWRRLVWLRVGIIGRFL